MNYQNLPESTNLVDAVIPGWLEHDIEDRINWWIDNISMKAPEQINQIQYAEGAIRALKWVLSLKREEDS